MHTCPRSIWFPGCLWCAGSQPAGTAPLWLDAGGASTASAPAAATLHCFPEAPPKTANLNGTACRCREAPSRSIPAWLCNPCQQAQTAGRGGFWLGRQQQQQRHSRITSRAGTSPTPTAAVVCMLRPPASPGKCSTQHIALPKPCGRPAEHANTRLAAAPSWLRLASQRPGPLFSLTPLVCCLSPSGSPHRRSN